jgi:hypothetical protein
MMSQLIVWVEKLSSGSDMCPIGFGKMEASYQGSRVGEQSKTYIQNLLKLVRGLIIEFV